MPIATYDEVRTTFDCQIDIMRVVWIMRVKIDRRNIGDKRCKRDDCSRQLVCLFGGDAIFGRDLCMNLPNLGQYIRRSDERNTTLSC